MQIALGFFVWVTTFLSFCGGVSLVEQTQPDAKGDEQVAPDVHVIGVYEGTYPPGVSHRRGFHPNGSVTVKIAEAKSPIILVLTSYEPVVWKVEDQKGNVIRVIASGYYKQSVEGLDKKVPITLISHQAGDKDYFSPTGRKPRPTNTPMRKTRRGSNTPTSWNG